MNLTIRPIAVLGALLIMFGLSVIAAAPAQAAEIFIRPVHGVTNLRFGAKYIDAGGSTRGHHGIDIQAAEGTAVLASAPGKVVFAGSTPNGRCVSIVHAGAIKTTYLPLSMIKVSKGEIVSSGQVVGYIGDAVDPSAKTPHLHMGAIFGGEYIDPDSLFRGDFNLDLSKIIRRGDIPPSVNPGAHFSLPPAAIVAREIPGFVGWLRDKTVSFIEWLVTGASGFFRTINTVCLSAWSWMRSIALNTGSFLWSKLIRFGENLFKWISGAFAFPLRTAIGAARPIGFESTFGTGFGVRVFDPSGDASTPNNEVIIDTGDAEVNNVRIFDSEGQVICRIDAWYQDGNQIRWTGVDNEGRIVSPGVYTIIIEYADRTEGFLAEAKWHS